MRFFANGPNIPDLLLQRCDQGRVVFLCGAGVSLKAEMPTFVELTQHVVEFLSPPDGSPISAAFKPWLKKDYDGPRVPLDQIFHLLYQEYGRQDVNSLVSERLSQKNIAGISHEHSVIARISSDPEGRPQIVTTNFDRLFDHCPGISDRIFEPPAFPEIDLGMPVHGVTHLHGRLRDPESPIHDYILSSADFGRAYLAEGWATKFVRALLRKYMVVLVGYKAEDPPVMYLLQGLNHDGRGDHSNLYAFDMGSLEDIEAKWRDRGVTPIAYDDHPDLWKTLEAWAGRADDPRIWRSSVVEMARKGPRTLSAHQRGQVAHLVRTTPGARLFSNSDPSPTAEWLCVFDAWYRAGKKSKGYGERAEEFDPLTVYGLDDDPERPGEDGKQPHRIYDHLLEWRRGDTDPTAGHSLSGRQPEGREDMPPRLFHLMNWSARHLNSPYTAWWAARQNSLHPRHIGEIDRQLKVMPDLHPEARRTWSLILESLSDKRSLKWDDGWFDFADKIGKEGWTRGVLRFFDDALRPILVCKNHYGLGESKPPEGIWGDITMQNIARWEVRFPERQGQELAIPGEVLRDVFQIAEGHLKRAASLLHDIGMRHFRTPTCYPYRDGGGDGRDSDNDIHFCWFLNLVGRMSEQHPAVLRGHVEEWDHEDQSFFRKLKLFALNDKRLFDANEAATIVLMLGQNAFWDQKVVRELLFLMADRWSGFSPENKAALFDRMLAGPNKMGHWSDENYPKMRDRFAARYARWLELQGSRLTKEQSEQLAQIISGIQDWSDDWASSLVMEDGMRSFSITTDDDPGSILHAPIGQVIELAKAESGLDYRSHTDFQRFDGLVRTNPRKALAALSHASRRGEYPLDAWKSLIQKWPKGVPSRLRRIFLLRITRLPHETMRGLSHTLGDCVGTSMQPAYECDHQFAWQVFDAVVSGLLSDSGSAVNSLIGETRIDGEIVQSSRRTHGHAINGPIGKLTEGWVSALNSLKLQQSHGIPEEFKTRVERLLAAPGEGGDQAVAILTHNISWLYYLDPTWVVERVLPWFNFEHPAAEPAWNGYLSAAKIPIQDIGERLKPMFLRIFPTIYQWNWDQDLGRVAAQMVVILAVFRKEQPDRLKVDEARQCIRNMSDTDRRDAVYHLGRIGKDTENGWSAHVAPFIEQTWPRERKYKTTEMVSAWVNLLDDTGDDFPLVLKSVLRFLVPVERASHWLYRFTREVGGDEPLTNRHPDAVLEMLDAIVPNDPTAIPAELAAILDLIEAADPNLASDRRYFRLIDLVENQ